MLVERDSVYVGDKFSEQVVSEAVSLFEFDVVNKLLIWEQEFRAGGGIYVYCLSTEAAVFKYSAEKVDLAN